MGNNIELNSRVANGPINMELAFAEIANNLSLLLSKMEELKDSTSEPVTRQKYSRRSKTSRKKKRRDPQFALLFIRQSSVDNSSTTAWGKFSNKEGNFLPLFVLIELNLLW